MNIKDIYRSYDFNQNYIKAARVEDEDITNDESIVNKKFVIGNSLYATELSERFVDSLLFEYVKDVHEKQTNVVLDKLLFPVINPTFTETSHSLKSCIAKRIESDNVLYYDQFNNLSLCVELSRGDRPNTTTPDLLITYEDNTYSILNADEIVDNEYTFNFLLLFYSQNKIKTIEVVENVLACDSKNDNYGEPYTDPIFNNAKIIKSDITEEFLYFIKINHSMLTRISNVSGTPTYELSDIPNMFTYIHDLTIPEDEMVVDILIPKYLYDDNRLFYVEHKSNSYSNDKVASVDVLKQNTNGEVISYNGIDYVKCQYNFGYAYNSLYDKIYLHF